jgi:hypothetical protein
MGIDASDEEQLLGATAQGRCNFTFNIRDFIVLAQRYPHHGGIILSAQKPMPEIFKLLDRLLCDTNAKDWPGRVCRLNKWKV